MGELLDEPANAVCLGLIEVIREALARLGVVVRKIFGSSGGQIV